jgi:glucan endo-1,3-alpha-glucosidase
MRRLIIAIAATAVFFGINFASAERASAQTPLVFAYYFLATSTYGETVAKYKQDIQDAQALGIDGFAVAPSAWTGAYSYYKDDMTLMFQAAQELGTGFLLFCAPEITGHILAADIHDMVNTFKGKPPASGTGISSTNYYWRAGKPMLTSYSGELGPNDTTDTDGQSFWETQVFTGGFTAAFYPFFHIYGGTAGTVLNHTPNYSQISAAYNSWWATISDGLFWAARGIPANQVVTGEGYAQAMRDHGKDYLAGANAYWTMTLHNETLGGYESAGGEGIAAQWNSIINVQKPPMVLLFTWCDETESYITPGDPASFYNYFGGNWPPRHPHVGMSELTKYFISWFKTNTQPAVTNDKLFYFYRTHSKDLTPTVYVTSTYFFNFVDDIFVTTILTAPATVRVTSGGNVTDTAVAAGIVHTRVPFTAGSQNIKLIRGGSTLINLDGDPIASSITYYDMNPTTGYGTSGSTTSGSTTSGSTTSTTSATPTLPTVALTSPGNGAVYKANGAINITASASDPSGVASITIGGDSRSLMTCTNATSCSATWQGSRIREGTHTISATANNTLGYSAKTSLTIVKLK